MGYAARNGAYYVVQQAFRRLAASITEKAARLRDLEDAELDALREVVTPAALAPTLETIVDATGAPHNLEQVNLAAIMVALRVHDRKVRLHGLAAPSKVDGAVSPLMRAVLESWPETPPPYTPVVEPLLPRGEDIEAWDDDEEDEDDEGST